MLIVGCTLEAMPCIELTPEDRDHVRLSRSMLVHVVAGKLVGRVLDEYHARAL